jgi:manganese-dependent inorganic pyrophosphatase
VQYLAIDDVNELAARQFRAKSHELSVMSPYQLVNGDMKTFKFTGPDSDIVYSVGYGVIETTDAEASIARVQYLIPEMRTTRTEKNLTCMFLAVVDIVHMTSSLLICGATEESLALAAYGGDVITTKTDTDTGLVKNNQVLELVGLVSRKKDFVPPLTRAVASGWKPPVSTTDTVPVTSTTTATSTIVMGDYDELGPGRPERIFDNEALMVENVKE